MTDHTRRRGFTVLPLALAGLIGLLALMAGCSGDSGGSTPPSRPTPAPTPQPADGSQAGVEAPDLRPPVLAFELPESIEIVRQYDQRRTVTLANRDGGPARVLLDCESPEDVRAGFVGAGSAREGASNTVTIAAGESWDFPFVLHADRALSSSYELPLLVQMLDEQGEWKEVLRDTLSVIVRAPQLVIETSWHAADSPADAARLARRLVIANRGDPVPDLSVFAAAELAGHVHISPTIEGTPLAAGDSLTVRVIPVLHADFDSLAGELVIRGHGQEQRVPYSVALPEGTNVHIVVTRSTSVARNSGSRCTNRRHNDYGLPPMRGTSPTRWGGGSSSPIQIRDRDWGGTGLEGFGASPPPPAAREAEDAGLADNAPAATAGVDDTVPPSSLGGDDPDASSREVTARRSGDDLDLLVHRTHGEGERRRSTLDYIPVMGRGKKLRASIPLVRGNEPISDPTLGRSSDGEPLAAYARRTPEGGSEIALRRPGADGAPLLFGDPDKRSARPQLIDAADGADLVWLEDGKAMLAHVPGNGGEAGTAPEALELEFDADRPLRARRNAEGELLIGGSRDGKDYVVSTADGRELARAPARDGDFALSPEGEPVVVVRRPDGAIAQVGETGAHELVPSSWDVASPAVVATPGGSRLLVHRPLSSTPAGQAPGRFMRDLVGGEWGPLTPVPQLEEPVTDAYVVLQFALPWGRALYKAMNTRISVNGVEIGRLDLRVPAGRFAFRVPPQALHLRAAGSQDVPANKVHIEATGVGPGHFHISDLCEIYAQHALIQDFVVAGSYEEAVELASTSTAEVRHGAPDLMLIANHWELPQNARPGEPLTALIGLLNVGDLPVEGATLVATVADTEIGRLTLPTVPPFVQRAARIPIVIPADWDVRNSLVIQMRADVEGDSRPDSNLLEMGLFGVPEPDLTGPSAPGSVDARLLAGAPELSIPCDAQMAGSGARWFRLRARDDGALAVELRNLPEDFPVDVDLFDEIGHRLAARPVEGGAPRRLTRGEWIYLRVGTHPEARFPAGVTLVASWEDR